MSKTKVLFIGKLPPPSTGEGNVILTYFQVLPDLGYELKLLDVGVRNPKVKANSINLYNFFRFFKHVVQLILIIIKWKPEIINANVASNFALFKSCTLLFIAKIFGKKTVAHFHAGWMINEYKNYTTLRINIISLFMKIPSIWILPSNYFSPIFHYFDISTDKLFVIRNSVKKEIFDINFDITHNNFNKLYKFIFVGSIIYRKGLDIIVEAFSKLERESYNFTLTVLGFSNKPNDEEKEIRELISSRLNPINIILLNSCDGDDYINNIRKNNFFLLPSRAENLPIALLETMKIGLIPIVSEVGAINSIVKDGYNGFLVSPNAESLYQKLKYIFTSKIELEEIKSNIQKYISENHSPYINGEKLKNIFNHLLINKNNEN